MGMERRELDWNKNREERQNGSGEDRAGMEWGRKSEKREEEGLGRRRGRKGRESMDMWFEGDEPKM